MWKTAGVDKTTDQFIMFSCHVNFLVCLGIDECPHRFGEVLCAGLFGIESSLAIRGSSNIFNDATRRKFLGLVPRYPLQKPPSRGLEGSGGEGGGGGRRSEGRRGLHLRKASRGLEGGFKGASRGLQGGLKGASPSEGFKPP